MQDWVERREDNMRKIDLVIDVTDAAGTGEQLRAAATVVVPSDAQRADTTTVLFGYPGGGYSRHYFDLQLPGGYSQAEYHAQGGFVFVTCDHLGVGDSDTPALELGFRAVARANSACAREVLSRLAAGTISDDLPPIRVGASIGIGQSFGGYLLTLAQAADPVFDGVAFLGWSGIQTLVPWARTVALDEVARQGVGRGWDNPRRPFFFRDDVPREIVESDLNRTADRVGAREAWGAAHYPGGPRVSAAETPMSKGAVSVEAATIDVPVLVAVGDVDVVEDLPAEASAYPRSSDITLCRFPQMGHMHNFAGTRAQLWRRLAGWAATAVGQHR